MPQPILKYDLTLTRWNLLTVILMFMAAASALAVLAGGKSGFQPHDVLLVNPGRVALADEKIDPNTATEASLRRLPRTGPKLVDAIVQYRRQYVKSHESQAFVYAEDLDKVKGIGQETVSQYKEHLCLPSATD